MPVIDDIYKGPGDINDAIGGGGCRGDADARCSTRLAHDFRRRMASLFGNGRVVVPAVMGTELCGSPLTTKVLS